MAKITRKTQKILAGSASNNGQFGSAAFGTKILSNDLDVLQALPAYDNGWIDAVVGTKKFPALEEFQAMDYIATRQLAYLFQEGMAEYDVGTTYYQNSIIKKAGTVQLYKSLTNDNIGNPLTDAVNWKFLIDLDVPSTVPQATETVLGIAKIATANQVATGTNDETIVTPLKLQAAIFPTGGITDFAGSTAPTGYLMCYGQIVNVADYPRLFSVIGATYGGNGVTTFGIPDLRGRVTAGKDNMGGTPAGRLTGQPFGVNGTVLGDAGGQEAHTMTVGELVNHFHSAGIGINPRGAGWPYGSTSYPPGYTEPGPNPQISGGGETQPYTSSEGGGAPFNVVQPTIIMNKIIKT